MMQTYEQLIPFMESIAAKIADVYGISNVYQAELLLQKYDWNTEQLNNEIIDNPDVILPYQTMSFPTDLQPIYCAICGDSDTQGIYGKCGHTFCTDCHKGHIKAAIDGGPTCITISCLEYKCATIIPRDVITRLLQQEPAYLNKYNAHIINNFVAKYGKRAVDGTKLYFCANPECNKVAVVTYVNSAANICCPCGVDLCSSCGLEYHAPCNCDQILAWNTKDKGEAFTLKWLNVNTKQCPKCKTHIEKNQGCNHMTCRNCKHEFCWICLANWRGHTQCNTASSSPLLNNDTNDNADVKRYSIYFEKHIEHVKSLRYARMLPTHNAATELYMNNARQSVIDGHSICKYAFIFIYYNADTTATKFFEDRIKLLQQLTDQLQELLELKTTFNVNATQNACLYDYHKDFNTQATIINATNLLKKQIASSLYDTDYHNEASSSGSIIQTVDIDADDDADAYVYAYSDDDFGLDVEDQMDTTM